MRKVILATCLGLALSLSAAAEMVRETTTTTTYSGTVSEMLPSSSTIVLKSDAAPPARYLFNDRTVWVDSAGNTVTMEAVRNQPVTVHYQREGDQMVVTRVVTQSPAPQPALIERKTTTTTVVPPPAVMERKTTTTTTTEVDR